MDGDAVHAILNAAREPHLIGGLSYRPTDWTVEDPVAIAARVHARRVAT